MSIKWSDEARKAAERDLQRTLDDKVVSCQLWDHAPVSPRPWWRRMLTRWFPHRFPPPPTERPVSDQRPVGEDLTVTVDMTLVAPWVNYYDSAGVVLASVGVDRILVQGTIVGTGSLEIRLDEA